MSEKRLSLLGVGLALAAVGLSMIQVFVHHIWIGACVLALGLIVCVAGLLTALKAPATESLRATIEFDPEHPPYCEVSAVSSSIKAGRQTTYRVGVKNTSARQINVRLVLEAVATDDGTIVKPSEMALRPYGVAADGSGYLKVNSTGETVSAFFDVIAETLSLLGHRHEGSNQVFCGAGGLEPETPWDGFRIRLRLEVENGSVTHADFKITKDESKALASVRQITLTSSPMFQA